MNTTIATVDAKCPCCSEPIKSGYKVALIDGSAPRHLECVRKPVRAAPPVARQALGGRRTGCSCGSVEGESRPSDCWQCRHDAE